MHVCAFRSHWFLTWAQTDGILRKIYCYLTLGEKEWQL
jgi:hypothetical protein